jgi:hypothetical protein
MKSQDIVTTILIVATAVCVIVAYVANAVIKVKQAKYGMVERDEEEGDNDADNVNRT